MTMPGPGTTTELRPVTPRRGGDRRLARAVALLAMALAVAVVKPWGTPPVATPSTSLEAVARMSADALVAASQPRIDATVDRCYAGLAWRLFTIQRDFGRFARWLQRLDTTATASGVLDPSIPTIEVVSEETEGLGFCAPYRAGPDVAWTVMAWRIQPFGGPVPMVLEPLPDEIPTDHGAVFAPPVSPGAAGVRFWPAGHFVFLVASTTNQTPVAWFGVDVEARTARR